MCALSRLLAVGVVLGTACSQQPSNVAPATAVAPLPAPPQPVSADDLPPRNRIEADGIALAEMVDGRVRLKSTAVWGEVMDLTFDNCDFYRGAIPTLERQLAPERVKHLAEMCPVPAPPVEVKAGKQAKRKVALKPGAKAKPTATAVPSPTAAAAPAAAASPGPAPAPAAPKPTSAPAASP